MSPQNVGLIRAIWYIYGFFIEVRFGSLADMTAIPSDVCFTPDNGH